MSDLLYPEEHSAATTETSWEGPHPHTLNMAGGSAVEGEGIVGSHIGETIGGGSESDSQGWDYIV